MPNRNTMKKKMQTLKNIARLVLKDKTHHTHIQFFRYCFVGGFAAIVDTGLVVYLTESLKLYYVFSVIAGFAVGILINYILSSIWVFQRALASVSKKQHLLDMCLFMIIGVLGLLLTLAIIWLMYDYLHFSILFSKVLAVGLVLFWNFTARKYLIFRNPTPCLH